MLHSTIINEQYLNLTWTTNISQSCAKIFPKNIARYRFKGSHVLLHTQKEVVCVILPLTMNLISLERQYPEGNIILFLSNCRITFTYGPFYVSIHEITM